MRQRHAMHGICHARNMHACRCHWSAVAIVLTRLCVRLAPVRMSMPPPRQLILKRAASPSRLVGLPPSWP